MINAIEQEGGEPGVYRVDFVFDGVPEVFIIIINGPDRFFAVRDWNRWRRFEDYAARAPAMKAISILMQFWHKGQRPRFPVNLADFVPTR
jgi:hypothetical protein